MQAKVRWRSQADGGRSRLPCGEGAPPYLAVVRFVDSVDSWPPAEAWSLVVERVSPDSHDRDWVANVYFLAPDAPHGDLRPGREFELYEGPKCVATGILTAHSEE